MLGFVYPWRPSRNSRKTDSPAASKSLVFSFRLASRGAAFGALAVLLATLVAPSIGGGQSTNGESVVPRQTSPETFEYDIEWRLITAGKATLKMSPAGMSEHTGWNSELMLRSVGLVSKLYRVNDRYLGNYDPTYCASSAQMSVEEGRRRRTTNVTYDRETNKASYLERDLVKNTIVHDKVIDIPSCVHDVVGSLYALRGMRLAPGNTTEIPISDGKKYASVRVEAQERENVKIKNVMHKTVRYEAFLFNGVVYSRKARLLVWLTDDDRRLPVQIRLRMGFPIGTVTLALEKIS
jgi:hypothetical protein